MLSLTLDEIAALTGATLEGDPTYRITGLADLHTAGPCDIAFFADPRYKEAAEITKAGALFMHPGTTVARNLSTLFTNDPKAAFACLCEYALSIKQSSVQGSIHPTAVIAPSAKLAADVRVGPHVVIEEEVVIGSACHIQAGCYVGKQVHIGESCHFFPHVTLLERSVIGTGVVIQSGTVIGSLGFGYKTAADGTHTFIPHLGNVVIEDDVEIGACVTIDRAQLGSTLIGKGTKIDNQVQIGHNVHVGPRNLFVAQVGIGGSSCTGEDVILAGKVGLNDHITLGSKVIVTAFSAVSKNLLKSGVYGGIPADPFFLYKRNLVHCRNLDAHIKRISELTERLYLLEARLQT